MSRTGAKPYSDSVAKRALDFCGALAALLIAAPFLAVGALSIRFAMGCPVLFRQMRTGRRGHLFEIVKLRTMIPGSTTRPAPQSDAVRLTRLGVLLRRTSIDELPQLVNVLKGDMSLVGPRPLLPEYLPRYTRFQARRHEVKPGITGWAQIHGRNRLSWQERFDCDVWYVNHCSFWLDIKILALMVSQVLRRDGISREGHATSPEFLGDEETLASQ